MSASSVAASRPYDVLLFDIEGTTTPISFVKSTLFPFVTRTLAAYLESTYDTEVTQADIEALIVLSETDAKDGLSGVVPIPRSSSSPVSASFRASQIESCIASVAWQMSTDRKSSALKALQGHIWYGGYLSGELRGELFGGADGDVVQHMRSWHQQGYTLAIYSSGSIAAQKLLFAHSQGGDLTPMLSAYFDTTSGTKQSEQSYRNITAALNVPAERILFLTDIWAECNAARLAGVSTIILDRPGNYVIADEQRTVHTFDVATDFHQVQAKMDEKRRKIEEGGASASTSSASSTTQAASSTPTAVDSNTF